MGNISASIPFRSRPRQHVIIAMLRDAPGPTPRGRRPGRSSSSWVVPGRGAAAAVAQQTRRQRLGSGFGAALALLLGLGGLGLCSSLEVWWPRPAPADPQRAGGGQGAVATDDLAPTIEMRRRRNATCAVAFVAAAASSLISPRARWTTRPCPGDWGAVQVTDNPTSSGATSPRSLPGTEDGELAIAEVDARGTRECAVHLSSDGGRSWALGGSFMVKRSPTARSAPSSAPRGAVLRP